ncbi:DNA-formamidopyrimidine glycosylase [Tetragenococcus koreensis]|uniref:DNA-formamidopyrimidine glycosylase n=1 Tax=Tetragenococcus koreensis TaxID=290335 RepID=UPI001EFFCF4C|nr:DNA-formamidopyrimidine glycosylase [Tetragenococcus koreensis]MCF1584467.1 DNA-formamidopyrimidine glycosylase [Tetragenococcus koreensis]MCF1614016.1 DNA-formamidopyrimidine glycosylase [Tetragenococcus koreensis]MCF1616526.1 DNA-formamidopyrimidine glycosylase [Tetragenococcus koreensis]MCF1621571.1 DNA-formamidopyrimidine glycosylase [Tetragenococcus koreensis]MCF1623794.1 DNA-formamidopyrimidine glycosylase [Tetragenococcus koreensis]
MPELPEVETVRKGLVRLVQDKTIAEVVVRWPRIIEFPTVDEFCQELVGQRIETITRRGKFLLFKLTDFDLISHLRMEGKYEYFSEKNNPQPDKHTHVIFKFSDGSQLHYNDVRKFGRMTLVATGQGVLYKGIQQLGPEPIIEEFLLGDFVEKLQCSSSLIKPLLLNQKVVAGLGNIYTDEALWLAKIHPQQPARTLNKTEIKRLHQAIIEVLTKAVKVGGTTIRTYKNALGEAGSFQMELNVYAKTSEPCPRCKTPIVKIKVAQRGTHFCPHCQKLKRRKQS